MIADVASPPAVEQDFAPSDSLKEVRSPTTTKPSQTVPAATTEDEIPLYEPEDDRTRHATNGWATGSHVPSNKPANTAEADSERPANASPDPFEPTALEQSDFEPDVTLFEPLPEDDLSGEFENIDTEIEEELEILDDLPDMWGVESDDEEADAPLYDVDVGGSWLSEYDKAKRLAGQTARRFHEHADELWPVLLDIFQESPWPITQRSIERLLVAGVSCEALALATEIRRIWRDHPEFGQALPTTNARGESWMYSAEAMSQLSWPRAARLADCWPSYPDAAEIECFLEDLFDRWHSNSATQRSFTSFQLYLGYSTGYLHGTLQDWPEFCFASDDAVEDAFDELESRASWSATCEALRRYGVERPMTARPVYVYPKSIDEKKKDSKTRKRKKK
ncbi:hypothetical protein GCM10028792_21860 [Salinisphaera aquimarina]